ncbi:MAG TPA: TIGR03557 family F420-dependent LLM class oxidoreductase [Actinomycetota bacterium]|nr:TIGR03557 family F420-dependent LLM class oxidoreductase [Actinomycetota bacterium]
MSGTQIGYHRSCEEHPAGELVGFARRAEEAGFSFALISDHFHPWLDVQGHAPFVWSVLGGIARATEKLQVGTGVTAPLLRIHPAIIAQAAATVATMMPGRFFLGVGTGENLNEHVVGRGWPPFLVRLGMLSEAIDVIRELWEGGVSGHRGKHFTVEGARIFDLPDEAPALLMAASGEDSARLAGQKADGLISVAADPGVIAAFDGAGGMGKPRYVKLTVCFDEDEEEARRLVRETWPMSGIPGRLMSELRLPTDFGEVADVLTADRALKGTLCSRDAEAHIGHLNKALEAGFDHIYVHQVGPKQEEFFNFYEKQVIPSFPT